MTLTAFFGLAAVSWLLLRKEPAELRADKEVVLAAVKQDGRSLEYASAKLRADKEVVLSAVKQDGRSLEYALWRPK